MGNVLCPVFSGISTQGAYTGFWAWESYPNVSSQGTPGTSRQAHVMAEQGSNIEFKLLLSLTQNGEIVTKLESFYSGNRAGGSVQLSGKNWGILH